MTNSEEIPSIGEVVEVLAIYRAQLIAELGEQRVKTLPISDEWGNGRTSMTLLLQNPEGWKHLLQDEKTRNAVYQTVLSQKDRAEA